MNEMRQSSQRVIVTAMAVLLSFFSGTTVVAQDPFATAPTAQKSYFPRMYYNIRLPEVVVHTANAKAALKTNLLFDLVGAPNLGVEIPWGERFSVTADAAYAYWQIDNLYALQTIQGGIGAKYWFNPRKRSLTGWNAGFYGLYSSRYDVQWKDGYQGDGFWSAGVSAGYALPVSRRLNLEFALAAGYFYTPQVRHYHRPESGHLLWDETRQHVGRFSLTKVQVNLVWLLGKRAK